MLVAILPVLECMNSPKYAIEKTMVQTEQKRRKCVRLTSSLLFWLPNEFHWAVSHADMDSSIMLKKIIRPSTTEGETTSVSQRICKKVIWFELTYSDDLSRYAYHIPLC